MKKNIAYAGLLALMFGFSLPVNAQQDFSEEMEILREKNMEYAQEMYEQQKAAQEENPAAAFGPMFAPGAPEEEGDKNRKYVYKEYKGKKGLEGVQLPQRLFNNVRPSR